MNVVKVHNLGFSRKLAKKILPKVGLLSRTPIFQRALSFVETGAAMIQGKGAGTGWDEETEINAALSGQLYT